MKRDKNLFVRILVLVLVILITILLIRYRNEIRSLSSLGFIGVFLLSILANATIIIPLPGVILTSAMGAIFSPFWVALSAGAGAAIGELTGYLAGFSGQVVIEHKDWYDRFNAWMRKYGFAAVFLLALIPNPLFDLAGIAAGVMGMKIWKFLVWSFFGKFLKMLLFAYTGESLFVYFSGLR